jgi:lipopolysaccharide transport system ATP-binding protein
LGRQGHGAAAVDFLRDGRRIGDELATLRRAWIEDQHENPINEIDIREPFKIKMEYELHAARPEPPHHNVHVLDQRGEYVFVSVENCASGRVLPGIYLAECNVPGNLLNDGCYFVGLAVAFTDQGVHISFHEKDALCITVRDPVLETVHTLRGGYVGPIPGPVRPRLDWQVVKVG